MNGFKSLAPKEQFRPIDSTSACITDMMKVLSVCPDRVRPLLSATVADSMIYTFLPVFAWPPVPLVWPLWHSVCQNGLNQQRIHSALNQCTHLLYIGLVQLCVSHSSLGGVVHVGRYGGRLVVGGPTDPATNRWFRGSLAVYSSAAALAIRAAARFISCAYSSVW